MNTPAPALALLTLSRTRTETLITRAVAKSKRVVKLATLTSRPPGKKAEVIVCVGMKVSNQSPPKTTPLVVAVISPT